MGIHLVINFREKIIVMKKQWFYSAILIVMWLGSILIFFGTESGRVFFIENQPLVYIATVILTIFVCWKGYMVTQK